MSQQAQQTGATAPDSPVMVVTSNVQKYAIKKKKVLSAEESELFELTQAAGITVDQEVFKWVSQIGRNVKFFVWPVEKWTDLSSPDQDYRGPAEDERGPSSSFPDAEGDVCGPESPWKLRRVLAHSQHDRSASRGQRSVCLLKLGRTRKEQLS